jgi:hypothetical protein
LAGSLLYHHPYGERTSVDGDQNKTIAVLEIPPVDSPQSAVEVAVASKGRQK